MTNKPQHDPLLVKLATEALAHQSQGSHNLALIAYKRIQRQFPDFVDAWVNGSIVLTNMGRADEALAMAMRAVEIGPGNAHAYCALANAHQRIGNINEAAKCFPKILDCDTQHVDCLKEALSFYDRVIRANPFNSVCWMIRGHIKFHLMDTGGAETDLKRALELDGNDVSVRRDLNILYLLQHRYREAWPYYKPNGYSQLGDWRDFGEPHWKGEQLNGRTLLVYTEHHGFGDVILFSRFFPQIRSQYGGRLLLSIYEPLKRLLSNLPGVDQIVVEGEPMPDFDFAVPLMKLPAILNIDPLSLPPATKIAPEHISMPSLDRPGFKVGLAWAGNPVHGNDKRRSMNSRFLDGLADMPGVAWYGLQKPVPVDPPDLPGFIDMSPHMGDFMDTAQIASQLDLIVTVDTSMAHLAGSLGLPTIVLLPYIPEWRWGLNSQHSPWYPYPDFLLLRQPAQGDWQSVIQLLRGRIAEFMASKRFTQHTE